jgi:hypothetical protein
MLHSAEFVRAVYRFVFRPPAPAFGFSPLHVLDYANALLRADDVTLSNHQLVAAVASAPRAALDRVIEVLTDGAKQKLEVQMQKEKAKAKEKEKEKESKAADVGKATLSAPNARPDSSATSGTVEADAKVDDDETNEAVESDPLFHRAFAALPLLSFCFAHGHCVRAAEDDADADDDANDESGKKSAVTSPSASAATAAAAAASSASAPLTIAQAQAGAATATTPKLFAPAAVQQNPLASSSSSSSSSSSAAAAPVLSSTLLEAARRAVRRGGDCVQSTLLALFDDAMAAPHAAMLWPLVLNVRLHALRTATAYCARSLAHQKTIMFEYSLSIWSLAC